MQWGWGGRSREALLLVALLEQAGIRRIWYRERHSGACVGGAGVCTVVDFAKTRFVKKSTGEVLALRMDTSLHPPKPIYAKTGPITERPSRRE